MSDSLLTSLELVACNYFGLTLAAMRDKRRDADRYVARHVFRTTAVKDFGFTEIDVAALQGITPASVYNSIQKVVEYGQYGVEYKGFLEFYKSNKNSVVKTVIDGNIERITNEAFDERFYKDPVKVNVRTGNHYFPAYHYITSVGAPENAGLGKWRQSLGHFSDIVLKRTAEVGTFVHDSADRMVKSKAEITHEAIHMAFPDEKEAQKVKDCLVGFMNFMKDQEPEVLESESMFCADDFGFTMDLKARIKEDDYKGVWILDWKTSKTATDEHKMQVEAERRAVKADRGAVVVLGNETKTKYTFSPVSEKKADYLYNKWLAIKNTAYVELLERGSIKPRENTMPSVFSLKNIKYTKNEANKSIS